MTEKYNFTPTKLARVTPCDWNATIDRCRGMIAEMELDERQEYIGAQNHEVNSRRSAAIADELLDEIEAEIASLQGWSKMALRWARGGKREWPGHWPPAD